MSTAPSPIRALAAIEAKLFLRDPSASFMVIGLPVGILFVFGVMPWTRVASPELGGQSLLSLFIAPLAVTLVVAMLALSIFPVFLATHREKGVLRRMQATPVSPAMVLVAQLSVYLLIGLVAIAVVLGLGIPVLDIELPANVPALLVVLALGTTALFSIGLLVGALAPSSRAANGIAMGVFFPMLALGGVWVPAEFLPSALRWAADTLPMGAMFNALRTAWAGNWPGMAPFVSLIVTTVVCLAVAARRFRWQ
ncbi:ABC transporter permease [Saccharomonospora xinjiangensis]|uniref:Transport permease protein n=1 Tax=Saccharomonospora xinjiangensis XJ-54 TaxID=882086 RepID=I0V6N0_9PSEU|nr:ABC transporter permease [Saccharomonospora xinjiangensis]EID55783.1 ABC-type multidrug transport system, permease component [Saccharomonospora xinjiangensis XJ-54]